MPELFPRVYYLLHFACFWWGNHDRNENERPKWKKEIVPLDRFSQGILLFLALLSFLWILRSETYSPSENTSRAYLRMNSHMILTENWKILSDAWRMRTCQITACHVTTVTIKKSRTVRRYLTLGCVWGKLKTLSSHTHTHTEVILGPERHVRVFFFLPIANFLQNITQHHIHFYYW